MISSSTNSRRKLPLIFSLSMPHSVPASTSMVGIIHYISVRCARNGGSWPGQHQGFGPRFPAHHLHRLCGSSQETILRRLVLRHPPTFSRSHPSEYSTFRMKSYASLTDLTLLAIDLPYVDIIWNDLTASFVQNMGLDVLSLSDGLLF